MHLSSWLFAATLSTCASLALAQSEPVIVEAESGTLGSQFAILNDGAVQYAAIQATVGGSSPGDVQREITFTVTFPAAGVYELYARLRVRAEHVR